MNKILAVTIGGLGDTVLFSPVIKALRKSYPEAYIELLVANRLAEEAYSAAKEVSCITFVNLNQSSRILKATALMQFLLNSHLNSKFEIGYFATGLNHHLGHLLKATGVVKGIAYAPHVPHCSSDLRCNLELAHHVNENISEKDIFIPQTEKSKFEARAILHQHNISIQDDNLMAVYPSVELAHRPRWQISKLIQVVDLIKRNIIDIKIVIVGSKKEGIEWAESDKDNIADANLAGKLSILGSAALLSQCCLALGNDGGLMHVAGAVRCPVVVIMPNTPLSYKPPGEIVTIFNSKQTCCEGLYPKRPKNCKRAKCLEDIYSEQVFKSCISILNN